jgi:transposase
MLYAGLDLSRKRLDFHLLDGEGATVERGATPPDADGLQRLSERLARHGAPVRGAIESMNGARFVHDRLELAGWQVEIADAQKVKGLAPLACKTDRIDAWVLAELCRRDLVPAIWLPDPRVRAERERARWRLHLVRHRVDRFASPRKLAGYSGLCPRVYQSGERDLRGPLSKQGPRYLRWALVEAATHACTHPTYRERYQQRRRASANSAAPRSPRSTSPAGSPKRSGTCSPATNPSLRQAPPTPWPPDGP